MAPADSGVLIRPGTARLMISTRALTSSGLPASQMPATENPTQIAAKIANSDWKPIPAARKLPSACEKLM